jgi:pyridoxal phosphate-dependent aminotransferase EpsN
MTRSKSEETPSHELRRPAESRPLLIIWGAGGHAKVVFDTARAMGYERIQFVDEAQTTAANFLGCPVTSPDAADFVKTNVDFVVAIGANQSRARCFALGLGKGWRPAKLIHPSATVSDRCQIGGGSVVFARAVLNSGATIGSNCIMNTASVVEHDCSLADHVHLCPASVLGGNVSIGALSLIGLNASLLPGIAVGSKAIVGAGAVVVRNVPDEVTVAGSPARVIGQTVREDRILSGRVLLSVPHMSGLEKPYVDEAFASNWLSTVGPNITAFEEEFSNKFNTAALALSSGTAAIHLGLRALGVGAGDTVFCSDLTFVASANPILYQGATPVFIDSDEATWNMDPVLLEEALKEANRVNRLPKAVVVVDLFGQCADMDPILECCGRYGVPVLEDAAEAIGATYKGRLAGTMGHVGVFSFNGNKMITTTGGGMLVSRNLDLVNKARFLSTQAREPGLAYEHREAGYNYRLSNVLAGIGRGQLKVLEERVRQRRKIAFNYERGLAKVPGVSLMPQAAYGESANWLSCFRIEEALSGCSRDKLISLLDGDHIETRPVWKPMHMQPLYKLAKHYRGDVGERLFREGICLPSSSSLSTTDQQYVIDRIKEHLAKGSS